MTTPDGQTTSYGWDAADRLTWVEHPLLGRAAFDRDASGRLVSAVAGGILQSWEHRDGFVVAHTLHRRRGRDPHRHQPRRATAGSPASPATTERQPTGPARRGHRLRLRRGLPARSRRAPGGAPASRIARLALRRRRPTGRGVDRPTRPSATSTTWPDSCSTTVEADGRRLTYGYDGAGRRTSAADDRGCGPRAHLEPHRLPGRDHRPRRRPGPPDPGARRRARRARRRRRHPGLLGHRRLRRRSRPDRRHHRPRRRPGHRRRQRLDRARLADRTAPRTRPVERRRRFTRARAATARHRRRR